MAFVMAISIRDIFAPSLRRQNVGADLDRDRAPRSDALGPGVPGVGAHADDPGDLFGAQGRGTAKRMLRLDPEPPCELLPQPLGLTLVDREQPVLLNQLPEMTR